MAGGGFAPPVSRLWALRDNHFSTLQAAARSRTGNLLITGQLLCQLSYDDITDKCRLAPIFIVPCAALSGHCFYVFSLYQQYPWRIFREDLDSKWHRRQKNPSAEGWIWTSNDLSHVMRPPQCVYIPPLLQTAVKHFHLLTAIQYLKYRDKTQIIYRYKLAALSAAYRHDYAAHACKHYFIPSDSLDKFSYIHACRLFRLWMPWHICIIGTAKTMSYRRCFWFYKCIPFRPMRK